MTGAELIDAFRSDTGDTAQPYGWSDAELLRWLNEGQDEAARRARLFVESDNADVCRKAITAGNPMVTLDRRVVFVRRASVVGRSLPLKRMRVRDMDSWLPGWDVSTAQATPELFIPDYQSGALRLHSIPAANGELVMTVVRLPMSPITNGGVAPVGPEIANHLHESLLHWVKFRAYLKEDADLKDEDLAKKALAMFEAEFGPKSSAMDERWISDNYDPDEGGLY
jgi:hypothetical protein